MTTEDVLNILLAEIRINPTTGRDLVEKTGLPLQKIKTGLAVLSRMGRVKTIEWANVKDDKGRWRSIRIIGLPDHYVVPRKSVIASKRVRRGSGVVAGRITIGRGSFWGAGLA